MSDKLHIDVETYSSVDLKTCGLYKYCESLDFEILLIAYALNDEPVRVLDLTDKKTDLSIFARLFNDPSIEKHAYNAAFERIVFKNAALKQLPYLSIQEWHCTMVHAAYCGLPFGLAQVSKVLNSETEAKSATGAALIKYFSMPCKPTKSNGFRNRNIPHQAPAKWDEYKKYCAQDVIAERAISRYLAPYPLPRSIKRDYILDQGINDRGVLVDVGFAGKALEINAVLNAVSSERLQLLTGLGNINSVAQLKKWLQKKIGKEIVSLDKEALEALLTETQDTEVLEVLNLKQEISKTSIKKYDAMLAVVGEDGVARGLFQFYGANRTGRWAGRLIQLQNLPKTKTKNLEEVRQKVKNRNLDEPSTLNTEDLSELIRTAFIPPVGYSFAVADFSAIEARVLSWLANETWRLEVFRSHGKIYEASAARMFGVPIEDIGKDSPLRAKGKVAELALGYQGAEGALRKMGGEAMGLSAAEMQNIASTWRAANRNIVLFWEQCQKAVLAALTKGSGVINKHLSVRFTNKILTIKLPSGRELYYREAELAKDARGWQNVRYKGLNQTTRQWQWVDTYGGKLCENITQAVARDLLADAMQRVENEVANIVMHIHDEIVCEVPTAKGEDLLAQMISIMSEPPSWAEGLPLAADGFLTEYYKKEA